MKHFFTNRVKTVLIITVMVAMVLGILGSLVGMSLPNRILKTILTPVRTGASRLVRRRSTIIFSLMIPWKQRMRR